MLLVRCGRARAKLASFVAIASRNAVTSARGCTPLATGFLGIVRSNVGFAEKADFRDPAEAGLLLHPQLERIGFRSETMRDFPKFKDLIISPADGR